MKSTLSLLLATFSGSSVLLHAAPEPRPAPRPVYASHRVTSETVGQAVDVQVGNLGGARKLYLVVTDGGDGFACDWTAWVNPVLKGSYGERALTDLKPVRAVTGWGRVGLNKNPNGEAISVAGVHEARGFGVHAPSLLEFDLPEGTTSFQARAALDDGGTRQGGGSTVEFRVYTQAPPDHLLQMSGGGGGGGGGGPKDPEEALAGLEAAPGLKVETFAAEPMLLSPSSIDVDHLGRVWVAEIVNYRGHAGKRPSGDRILVLEDTDGDGRADKQTVFAESTDIVSPHGVTVLGNRVIVSAAGKVLALTDEDGDLKADRTEVIFQGIHGAQHDHSVHAVHFGPDGKLYFNFGNESAELKDRNGRPVVDRAGNVVAARRAPYQEGMIFRCGPDGSQVETLAWNFRNNWEMAVDSFGGIWQSDNDDDGNQSVRINFVLPWGNYGFKDEMTGGSWTKGEAKGREEIAARHWHQADPGVVPNLLHTGAGSPCGIVVYEGTLLPELYRGQMIHCDAGPNIVRAYPVKKQGAGYTAQVADLVEGKGDRWFRPSDVSVAPDGSLIVADWYDPGVGGHAMGDLDRGRLYRIIPEGHSGYKNPALDLKTPAGAVAALSSPNEEARYLGFTALRAMGDAALPAVEELAQSPVPHLQARALWLLAQFPGKAEAAVHRALASPDEDLRATGIRIGLQAGQSPAKLAGFAARDASAAVRREGAIALRFDASAEADAAWAELAAAQTGGDRWMTEALGIGADLHWDQRLAAYLVKVPDPAATPGGREVVWRSRARATPALLAKIIKGGAVPEDQQERFMRAFDFQKNPEKDQALESLLE